MCSDSAEFLSCVESAFCSVLWNKLECWWCDSTGKHSPSPRVCKCDLLLVLLHFSWRLLFWNNGHSIKLLDLCRNNNRKKIRNYCVLYQVWNVCQWELPVSSTAPPANLLADWPMSAPLLRRRNHQKPWNHTLVPAWTTTLCTQVSYLWPGWLQSWGLLPSLQVVVSAQICCSMWVGGSCCVKVWELLWVVLPSESCSSGVQFHNRHLVTAKPVQSQPFPSLNYPFPPPSSKCWTLAWAMHLFTGAVKRSGFHKQN